MKRSVEEPNNGRVGAFGKKSANQQREMGESLSEIEKMKREAKEHRYGTPRPGPVSLTGDKARQPNEVVARKCFIKKPEEEHRVQSKSEILRSDLKDSKESRVRISVRSNTQKEKISQILQRYGKHKEGESKASALKQSRQKRIGFVGIEEIV